MSRHHAEIGQAAWEVIRQRAFAEQGRRCSRCGKAGALEVHHVKELAHGGTNDLSNLEVLCRDCHIATHRPVHGVESQAWQVLLAEVVN